MPFTLLPFTSSIDCKNKIDSFLKNANCMENNIEHLYPLVNEFFKYLRNILQISFWLKVFVLCCIHLLHACIKLGTTNIHYNNNYNGKSM